MTRLGIVDYEQQTERKMIKPDVIMHCNYFEHALSYLLRYLESAEGSPVTVSVDQQHDENGSNARIRMYKTVESPDLPADQLFDPLLA